jgi:hypothetical protein
MQQTRELTCVQTGHSQLDTTVRMLLASWQGNMAKESSWWKRTGPTVWNDMFE